MNSTTGAKCCRMNALSPEVARHQSVSDRAAFAFNSRRLHHFSSGNRANQLDFPAASAISPRPNPPWTSAPPSPSKSRMAASSAAGLKLWLPKSPSGGPESQQVHRRTTVAGGEFPDQAFLNRFPRRAR